jgi:polyhydroxybutyrate depolymerase
MLARLFVLAIVAALLAACSSNAASTSHSATSEPASVATATSAAPANGSAGCTSGSSHAAGDSNETIESGGISRTYILHIPASYNASNPSPLLIAFHGFAMPAQLFATYHRFGQVGDPRGFIVATPSGTGDPPYWNAHTGGPSTPDDVLFVRDLLAKLDASFCTDASRTYVAGYSMGGAMAELIACEMPDRIGAVGLVAAVSIGCGAKAPMIDFHGTDDIAVPFEGADAGDARGASPPVRRVASEWARGVGCDGLPSISRPSTDVELSTFRNCPGGDGEVLLYTVINGGHTWPGAKLDLPVGHTTQSVDASSLMLDFFEAHAKAQ